MILSSCKICRSVLLSIVLAVVSASAGTAYAQESLGTVATGPTATSPAGSAPAPEARLWSGEVEAGVITTSGNSQSDSMRARAKVQYEPGQWKHLLTGDFLKMSEQGTTTAEQYTAAWRSSRTLSVRSYLYAIARYEVDPFAGYRPRVTESAGYGRRFPFSAQVRLEMDAGAGGSQTWFTDGSRNSEPILRLAANLEWKLSATSEFLEEAFSEFGDTNVHSESQTSIKMRINTSFAMKLNVTVKHDTAAPEGRSKTDTITSVTLVYDL